MRERRWDHEKTRCLSNRRRGPRRWGWAIGWRRAPAATTEEEEEDRSSSQQQPESSPTAPSCSKQNDQKSTMSTSDSSRRTETGQVMCKNYPCRPNVDISTDIYTTWHGNPVNLEIHVTVVSVTQKTDTCGEISPTGVNI